MYLLCHLDEYAFIELLLRNMIIFMTNFLGIITYFIFHNIFYLERYMTGDNRDSFLLGKALNWYNVKVKSLLRTVSPLQKLHFSNKYQNIWQIECKMDLYESFTIIQSWSVNAMVICSKTSLISLTSDTKIWSSELSQPS